MKSCKSHEKKWNEEHKTLSFKFLINSILMFFVFTCGLQDFKFWYVNCKAFGASFLFWIDFTMLEKSVSVVLRQLHLTFNQEAWFNSLHRRWFFVFFFQDSISFRRFSDSQQRSAIKGPIVNKYLWLKL